jgi:drug/metabolite transporter (DMT)-like permease
MSLAHVVAVVLATIGAVLFGLAAVQQHGAVRAGAKTGDSPPDAARRLFRLVRDRSWLVGAVQATVAGSTHVVALTLAPITLVQPVGVVAVPVTVVASAWRRGHRPSSTQMVGSVMSVAGIAVLTLLLLSPTAQPVVLPAWAVLAGTVLALVALTALVVATTVGASRPGARSVALATLAALLFGLNSVLLKVVGETIRNGFAAADRPDLIVSVLGLALALPVGLWAMQAAYLTGSAQVVICCLTLADPLAAVIGGYLLLGDGVGAGPGTLIAALACSLVAAAGVVVLSKEYPPEVVPGGAGLA